MSSVVCFFCSTLGFPGARVDFVWMGMEADFLKCDTKSRSDIMRQILTDQNLQFVFLCIVHPTHAEYIKIAQGWQVLQFAA